MQKYIIFKKSSKGNQNPSRYCNSITNLKIQHKPNIIFQKSSYKNIPITEVPKSLKLLYSIMNLNTISLPWQARPKLEREVLFIRKKVEANIERIGTGGSVILNQNRGDFQNWNQKLLTKSKDHTIYLGNSACKILFILCNKISDFSYSPGYKCIF